MKLILEVHKEKDLKMLLMLLERLDISYNEVEKEAQDLVDIVNEPSINEISYKKNYDQDAIQKMLKEIKEHNVFEAIENPSEWQKNLRDEWK
jgi:hypothetical protein